LDPHVPEDTDIPVAHLGFPETRARERPFRSLLRLGLPDRRMTALLRACLYSGEEGRRAWSVAEEHIEELSIALKHDLRDAKNLVPLLAAAEVRNVTSADRSIRTLLRTGLVREELRITVFRRILRSVLSILREGREPFALTGGSAAMHTLYDPVGPRHTHGIDILTTASGVQAGSAALTAAGFQLQESSDVGVRITRHETGLPIRLRSTLTPWLPAEFDSMMLLRRAEPCTIAGGQVLVLTASDTLMDICATGFDPAQRDGSLWVCDGWLLLKQRVDLDWQSVLAVSNEARLADFVWAALDFLVRDLDAPVPGQVLESLQTQALPPTALARDVVLRHLRASVGWRRMAGAVGSWRRQVSMAGRLAVPSVEYMRGTRPVSHNVLLPWHYALRVLRFLKGVIGGATAGFTHRGAAI